MQQISLFCGVEPLNITKKIRLIELFAGIGAQAKALKNIGADFKHYRICEFDKYAVASYNAIHGTDFKTSDITKIHASDLSIIEKDKYEYIMTYSFPCTDLSLAGKQEGMAKGSDTRSGLLWEVERLLEECGNNLPQILLMENVDAILFEKNRKHFFQWCNRLEEFGYKNYYQVLNAKDYGIPQNRNRCFMVSILGNYYFEFPKPIKLELCVKDMLEKEVPEKYYLSKQTIDFFISNTIKQKEKGNGFTFNPTNGDGVAKTITSKAGSRMDDNFITDDVCIPCLTPDRLKKRQNGRRFKENGDSMFTLTAQDIHGVVISNPDIKQLGNISIRKLTPRECFRLMGFEDIDFTKAKYKFDKESDLIYEIMNEDILESDKVKKIEDMGIKVTERISNSQCYKQAGNSIVVKVLEAIFRNMNIKGVKRWQE
jgi:DNA (cytosine-5)-methyltransferase 1